MTMRGEFEAWRVRNIKSQKLAAAALAQGPEGVYDNTYTLTGWQAWQAAYAAGQRAERGRILALIPMAEEPHPAFEYDDGHWTACREIAAAIQNKGE